MLKMPNVNPPWRWRWCLYAHYGGPNCSIVISCGQLLIDSIKLCVVVVVVAAAAVVVYFKRQEEELFLLSPTRVLFNSQISTYDNCLNSSVSDKSLDLLHCLNKLAYLHVTQSVTSSSSPSHRYVPSF